jgi:hypothetical protein
MNLDSQKPPQVGESSGQANFDRQFPEAPSQGFAGDRVGLADAAMPIRPLRAYVEETAMKLSSMFLAMFCAVVIIAGLLMVLGVNLRGPLPQGAALYDPATEVMVSGVVTELREYACPVSEGELGDHVMLRTSDGLIQVHLAPGRVMRKQKLSFAVGDQLTVTGSKVKRLGKNDIIAREITRGNEDYILRDRTGTLMTQ